MTNISYKTSQLGAFMMALTLLILTGCDALNSNDPEVATLSATELEEASEILSQSLSDQSEGLMANLNDMTATVQASGLSHDKRAFHRNPALRPCRGVSREFSHNYAADTGEHTLSYARVHEGEKCSKEVQTDLVYIFSNAEGGFIAAPRVNKSEISTIDFKGTRSGSATFTPQDSVSFSSTFSQEGAWLMTGLNSESLMATLNGAQTNIGSFSKTRGDSLKEGTYELNFEAVDVTIDGSSTTDRDLEHEITGTINYTLVMTRTHNGVTETKEAEGTIELEGNGRALLRFLGLRKVYRIHLADGRVDNATEQAG